MFGSLMSSMHFHRKLEALEKKSQYALKVKSDTCQKCSFCCWKAPGGLSKANVEPMAKFLGITPKELFENHLTVHDLGRVTEDKFVLIPIRHHQIFEAGRYLSASGSFDIDHPCSFLDVKEGKCVLHGTDAQPIECHTVVCLPITEDGPAEKYWTSAQLEEVFGFDALYARRMDGCFDSDED
jgi:Fe-S-cluster containining protein